MKTITIYPPVEIFPDPEFCEDDETKCKYIVPTSYSSTMQCGLFRWGLNNKSKKDKRVSGLYLKCDECKTFYQESKT